MLICTLTWFFFSPFPSIHATTLEFKGKGELIVVSPRSQTAVIDIAEKNRQRIIGGKLAPDAILLKNDRKVDLSTFHVGENVMVIWRITENGKEILSLLGSGQIADQPIKNVHLPSPLSVQPKLSVQTVQSIQHVQAIEPAITPPFHTPPLSQAVLSESTIRPVIGTPLFHTVGPKETLLDIARHYDLGFNELVDLYSELDPWLPPAGKRLMLPTERILPEVNQDGIVINIAELRLYHYVNGEDHSIVRSFPVSIGDPQFQTPSGTFSVGNKVIHPTWFIPPSLRPKYHIASVPPGPDNPLGQYWVGLRGTSYGIHGTDIAWSIGRTVTHGCIRMYPEDIKRFFPTINVGSTIQLTYQPVKVALLENRVIIEVHKDIYSKIGNMFTYGRAKLQSRGLWNSIDQDAFKQVIQNQHGIPVDITRPAQSLTEKTTLSEIPIIQSNNREY